MCVLEGVCLCEAEWSLCMSCARGKSALIRPLLCSFFFLDCFFLNHWGITGLEQVFIFVISDPLTSETHIHVLALGLVVTETLWLTATEFDVVHWNVDSKYHMVKLDLSVG